MTDTPEPRKGMPSPQIDEAEFRKRFLSQYVDPAFDPLRAELGRIADVLADWPYPRHLEGRVSSVIVHGDVEGAENVRRSLADWLRFMKLKPAGPSAELDRYIGYWKPYATSHQELDADHGIQEEVRNAARTLLRAVQEQRAGKLIDAGEGLEEVRQK
jgi:multimeric flavodoxin WrbA